MANGTLVNTAPGQGKTDLLRSIINALGGTGSLYAGESELLAAIAAQVQNPQIPDTSSLALQPAGAVAATHDRAATNFAVTVTAGASGVLNLSAIYIPANTIINNINYITGTTGSTGVTHNWVVLADSARKVLAVSADNTTTDVVASTLQTVALTAPFTTTYSGLYYVGVMFATGTTQPTFQGQIDTATTVMNVAPKLCGSSNTGATVPVAAGATLTAITTTVGGFYAFLT